VTIIRRSASEDEYDDYGNEEQEEVTVKTKGDLQQRSRTEAEQTVGAGDWVLFLHPGTGIDMSDVVQVDGQRYEVVGPPDELHSIVTHAPDHIEVSLRYTGGAS
jgi:hypothetical protein